MKFRGVSFWLMAVSALLALAGTILLIVSDAVPNQSMQQALWVIIAAAAGVLAIAFSTFGFQKIGDTVWMSAIAFAGLMCVALSFGFLAANRIPLVVNLATWDGLNTLGWTAFYTAAAGMICDFFAMLLLSAAMFCRTGSNP